MRRTRVNPVLSVAKPWGKTRIARERDGTTSERVDPGLKIALTVVALVGLVFLVVHLAGGGLHHRSSMR